MSKNAFAIHFACTFRFCVGVHNLQFDFLIAWDIMFWSLNLMGGEVIACLNYNFFEKETACRLIM